MVIGIISAGVVAGIFVLSGLKVVNEYERGVRFRLGKFAGEITPGLRFVIPIIETWRRVDMRIKAVDVPSQEAITKDNVSVTVNAVIYYKVSAAQSVILQVEKYNYAVSQLAQTTMRNVVGEVSLDKLLANRDDVSKRIRIIVDKATDPWGIKVDSVELKDVIVPGEMKRVMAKEAEAEREKRAVIIKAEGEVLSATNMSKAAAMLAKAPGALHLRTLQSINDISADQSNTIVYMLPIEALRALEGISTMGKRK
ncbi:hypothetical protein COV93_01225 [Candidatus Woesearchaeota archaeon CG11_big_fil_rev_8_21_14_0_20_43_8]|nr:MAG: hypothetical protein COV93_01225 [Candidatus Woesearchaeota archaeon CG11_big_fil_rev_8_21_14_0_20_43_8]PIO05732.1 MAG: hypothetical protein COT47_03565 [Candidatus Woesearchaeota archaeon CG08_land_8_20_14_0_20_43_7]